MNRFIVINGFGATGKTTAGKNLQKMLHFSGLKCNIDDGPIFGKNLRCFNTKKEQVFVFLSDYDKMVEHHIVIYLESVKKRLIQNIVILPQMIPQVWAVNLIRREIPSAFFIFFYCDKEILLKRRTYKVSNKTWFEKPSAIEFEKLFNVNKSELYADLIIDSSKNPKKIVKIIMKELEK